MAEERERTPRPAARVSPGRYAAADLLPTPLDCTARSGDDDMGVGGVAAASGVAGEGAEAASGAELAVLPGGSGPDSGEQTGQPGIRALLGRLSWLEEAVIGMQSKAVENKVVVGPKVRGQAVPDDEEVLAAIKDHATRGGMKAKDVMGVARLGKNGPFEVVVATRAAAISLLKAVNAAGDYWCRPQTGDVHRTIETVLRAACKNTEALAGGVVRGFSTMSPPTWVVASSRGEAWMTLRLKNGLLDAATHGDYDEGGLQEIQDFLEKMVRNGDKGSGKGKGTDEGRGSKGSKGSEGKGKVSRAGEQLPWAVKVRKPAAPNLPFNVVNSLNKIGR